jgi:DNA (cytosine-5)-methyltransferase 1
MTMLTQAPLTVVDLFCGAGGLSLGLRRAGFDVIFAADHFKAAVDSYRRNLGDHVHDIEIAEDTAIPPSTLIVGGPPCQGFSSAGMRRAGDHRNTLVTVFAKIIARNKPLGFIFENVEGFLTGDGGERVLDLLKPVIEAGYRVHLRKVNAANYGVPQHRKRVLAIGGLGWEPTFPEPTHSAYGAPGAHRGATALPLCPTLMDALAGLPEPAACPPGLPTMHFHPPLDDSDLERVHLLKQGQTMRDLPERLWHDSYRRRAFRRVKDGTPTERRGGAPAGVRRLRGDEPSKAITGGARSEFVHPAADRYVTLRECARTQTFPDDFEFIGTQSEQSLLIGNAVPPQLAEAVGRHLVRQLQEARTIEMPGALLSFVPTMSTGMSPALERITDLVHSTFMRKSASPHEPASQAPLLRLPRYRRDRTP